MKNHGGGCRELVRSRVKKNVLRGDVCKDLFVYLFCLEGVGMRLSDSCHFRKLPKAPMAALLCAPSTLGTDPGLVGHQLPLFLQRHRLRVAPLLRRGAGTTWACPVSSRQMSLELLQKNQGRSGLCGLAETRALAWW